MGGLKVGKKLERYIEKSFENLPFKVFYVRNKDGGVTSDKYGNIRHLKNKSFYDCSCFDGENNFVLEAKTTGLGSLPLDNITDEQISGLLECSEVRGKMIIGFIIEYRKIDKIYFVPIRKFMEIKDYLDIRNIKSISPKVIEKFGIKEVPYFQPSSRHKKYIDFRGVR